MNDVFLELLNRSITAGWVIAAVIVLRFLLRRAPKWLCCVLWAIVGVRLICPFSFESEFSLIPDTEITEIVSLGEVRRAAEPMAGTGPAAAGNTQDAAGGGSSAPESGTASPQTWIFAGSVVWVSGLAILFGFAMVSFLRIRRNVEEGLLLYDNVYTCDAVRSPFILGLIRPRIYLPSDTQDGHLEYVLAHERAHLKRKDHWWKSLGYALLAVYWFNPLVWAAYILLCRDIELACDEKAVRDLDMAGRKGYSKALMDCSMKRRMIMACPLAFGEVGVKERVRTVLNYRKPAFWLIAAAALVCAAAAVCFLTDSGGGGSLAERIDAQKDELTEQIGTMVSEAEAVRYSITDWKLIVGRTDAERADCYFGANWISARRPEDDPMIQGMYQSANSLSDEAQRAYALEIADGWLVEMQSWPREEYLEEPIVIMREGRSLGLYYPYVMDGAETLIPLQEYIAANWTEDSEKRYQEGVRIIEEAVSMAYVGTDESSQESGQLSSEEEEFYLWWNPLLLNYYNTFAGHKALYEDFAYLAGEGMRLDIDVRGDDILEVSVIYEDDSLLTEGIEDELAKQLEAMTDQLQEQRSLYCTDIIGPASVRILTVSYVDQEGNILAHQAYPGQ